MIIPSDEPEVNEYRSYGQYPTEPNQTQLETYFVLTPLDLELIAVRRLDSTRLGMALQLCTLRFLGTFLENPLLVPKAVTLFVSKQLGLENVNLERYQNSKDARLEHRKLIAVHLGYRDFEGAPFLRVARMLLSKLSIENEVNAVLIDLVTRELESSKVILPSIKRIMLLIGRCRKRANMYLYHVIASRLSTRQSKRLFDLLLVPKEPHIFHTHFETLRTQPIMSSTVTIQAALARITKIRDVGVVSINLEDIAQNRLDLIIRHGLTVKAADLEKYSRVRCLATLVVVIQFLERSATDDALTIFDAVMQQTGVRSQNRHRKERLRSLKDLDAAALTLRDVARLVLDSSVAETELRKRIFEQFGEARLLEAISQISEKASSVEDEETRIWENAHQSISGFIIGLLETIHFEAVPAAKSLLIAMNFVKKTSKTATSTWGDPPRGFIPKTWLRLIFPFGEKGKTIFKRQHYVVCVAHQLYLALKRGDVFVPRSNHHHDPRAAMLQGEEWKAVKDDVLAQLGLHEKSEVILKTWSKLLDDKFRSVNPLLEDNPKVRLTKDETAPNLTITPFDALPESPSLIALNRAVEARLPNIALPELLLEIDARLGFTQDMLQTATGHAIGKDTKLSLIAVLVAQACNIGLSAVFDESNPALKLERLSRVKKYYLNPATISQANALLVKYHSKLAMTKRWGDGEIASADGLRFVVPVKTIHAGANPKYFGVQRGITYYTLVSDQFTQLHGQVIPGTIKDSLYILSALLEQQTVLRPQKVISDTGAYSDVIFGLFFLLGYQFSPRLKDAGGARYWRINRQADYGKLNKVARYSINTRLIHQHWEDILRLLGSLKLGKIKAVDALRVLARDSILGGLGKAVQEIGQIAKTLFLLGYVTDENIQRGVHLILTHGETRHSLARATYHGNQGEVRQHYQVGVESQLGALGFVVNVIVLWNTLYTQAALEIIDAMGDDVFEEDVMRLSPLKWKHINMLGYYDFTVSPEVEAGDLRPLRDPNMLTDQELLELIESE